MKIISIVGARPQFIKLAPLSKALNNVHEEIIVHTGQHFDNEMSDSFFSDLAINQPKYNLGVQGGSHGDQTGRMLAAIEKVLIHETPDLVVVFGDTNSTLAGSLAAVKLHICVVHIEAGLRSFNRKMPEEINRIVADHAADYLFAPTLTAMKNLEAENLGAKSFLTGDIMVDAHNMAATRSKRNRIPVLPEVKAPYFLLTLHRPYNVDEPGNLSAILKELGKLDSSIIFPVHPRTKKIIETNQIPIPENIVCLKPLGYLDFVHLQSQSSKIITDSGGIQKEAYILQKPCITLRPETEWLETVDAGWNLLINPFNETQYAQKIENFYGPSDHPEIFGRDVAEKMVDIINSIGK